VAEQGRYERHDDGDDDQPCEQESAAIHADSMTTRAETPSRLLLWPCWEARSGRATTSTGGVRG